MPCAPRRITSLLTPVNADETSAAVGLVTLVEKTVLVAKRLCGSAKDL